MPARYRIGEFAGLGGVSAKTLRFYGQVGLLRPASIDPRTGYRYYVPDQLRELAFILALKELGMPLAKVRDVIRRPKSAEQRRRALRDLREGVKQSIKAATDSLHWIDEALKDLDQGQEPVSVVVKRQPAVRVASVRSQAGSYSEIECLYQRLLREVPEPSRGALHGVLWHRCLDSGHLEGEPFVTLSRPLAKSGAYEIVDLPAVTLACAYSPCDDEDAEGAYDSIRQWMAARGYRLAGPKREIYLDDMLEIQFPLRS